MQPQVGQGDAQRHAVSILYEADRLCNSTAMSSPWRAFSFQSSTRQTDFATRSTGSLPTGVAAFQSSTRQTDFATAVAEVGGHVLQAVSILYEADRLCNRAPALNVALRTEVSILYEADRLCNAGRTLGGATPSTCFNPLRGRQTLQLWRWPRPPPWLGGFNPLRGRQTLQPWPRWRRRRSPQRFNPLRGRQTLQLPSASSRKSPILLFQSSTRQTDFATPCAGRGR